jgi:gliding motility-associated protein GldL
MMNVSDLVQSSGWKNFMAKLYGMGASVVIIGALFKINHWPGGSFIITLGLVTEAIIFFFSAFEPLHEELDWTLVYPELAGMSDPDEVENFKENVYEPGHRPIENIEDVLGQAGVDDEVMKKLAKVLPSLVKVPPDLQKFQVPQPPLKVLLPTFKLLLLRLDRFTKPIIQVPSPLKNP